MKYPKFRAQANMSVKVPGLSGGINVHDTLSTVDDNQLTAADNMWWKNAALRTRPGMRDTGDTYDVSYTDQQWVSDREVLLTSCVYQSSTRAVFSAAKMTQENGFEKIGQGGQSYYAKPVNGKAPTAFGCHAVKSGAEEVDAQSDHLYFLSSGEIIEENKSVDNPAAGAGWVAAEPYIPTVSIWGGGENGSGYANEDYNMLTGAFKCTFSPDGISALFILPQQELTHNSGETVTVKVSLLNTVTNQLEPYEFSFAPDEVVMEAGQEVYVKRNYDISQACIPGYESYSGLTNQNLYVKVNWTQGTVSVQLCFYPDSSGSSSQTYIPLPNNDAATIEITAWKTNTESLLTICGMTGCVYASGNRFFVYGNPEKPSLLHWSDVSNPLYFPENNYAYLGDHTQRITAIRQQGDLVVVFKEHELYGMTYNAADEDAYEYAMESGVSVTSISARYSAVPIHAAVGCDCPGSVRLVNNRLVWANSDGKVYMLPSVNQYNERNVRELSRNIFPLLSQHSADALKTSFSGEFGGYYVLLVENIMYLLDAQTSAFTSFNYYSKEENAQKALPWFRWTLPKADYVHLMANDTVMYLSVTADGTGRVYALDNDTDNGEPIVCSFTTKMFDFDRPDKKKAVNQMYIGIGDSPESTVDISYITEHDEYTDAWSMESFGDYDEREPGFMRVHRLTPNISRARVFGFRCDSVGAVAIGDILLKFKEQGVVR